MNIFFRISLFFFMLFNSGCAYLKPKKTDKKAPSHKSAQPTTKPQHKSVDIQAQQKYYDLGLKHYTEENYVEARKAWQQVLQLGPSTSLSEKARDYLKKTEQVLKTLKEFEKK